MKHNEKECHHGHHGHHGRHFIINLAFHAVTLATALATLHSVEKLRHKVKELHRK